MLRVLIFCVAIGVAFSQVKEYDCPNLDLDFCLSDKDLCSSDYDCGYGQKCCPHCALRYKFCIDAASKDHLSEQDEYMKNKQCPEVKPCYSPLKYDVRYRCGSDEGCAYGYKCCKSDCYIHKICRIPVDEEGIKVDPPTTTEDLAAKTTTKAPVTTTNIETTTSTTSADTTEISTTTSTVSVSVASTTTRIPVTVISSDASVNTTSAEVSTSTASPTISPSSTAATIITPITTRLTTEFSVVKENITSTLSHVMTTDSSKDSPSTTKLPLTAVPSDNFTSSTIPSTSSSVIKTSIITSLVDSSVTTGFSTVTENVTFTVNNITTATSSEEHLSTTKLPSTVITSTPSKSLEGSAETPNVTDKGNVSTVYVTELTTMRFTEIEGSGSTDDEDGDGDVYISEEITQSTRKPLQTSQAPVGNLTSNSKELVTKLTSPVTLSHTNRTTKVPFTTAEPSSDGITDEDFRETSSTADDFTVTQTYLIVITSPQAINTSETLLSSDDSDFIVDVENVTNQERSTPVAIVTPLKITTEEETDASIEASGDGEYITDDEDFITKSTFSRVGTTVANVTISREVTQTTKGFGYSVSPDNNGKGNTSANDTAQPEIQEKGTTLTQFKHETQPVTDKADSMGNIKEEGNINKTTDSFSSPLSSIFIDIRSLDSKTTNGIDVTENNNNVPAATTIDANEADDPDINMRNISTPQPLFENSAVDKTSKEQVSKKREDDNEVSNVTLKSDASSLSLILEVSSEVPQVMKGKEHLNNHSKSDDVDVSTNPNNTETSIIFTQENTTTFIKLHDNLQSSTNADKYNEKSTKLSSVNDFEFVEKRSTKQPVLVSEEDKVNEIFNKDKKIASVDKINAHVNAGNENLKNSTLTSAENNIKEEAISYPSKIPLNNLPTSSLEALRSEMDKNSEDEDDASGDYEDDVDEDIRKNFNKHLY